MHVLLIGNGGREHALAWKLAASDRVSRVTVAPGNAGIALEPKISLAPIAVDAIDELLAHAQAQAVDLTIVGPEVPLVAGVVDRFTAAGLRIFGPSAAAARLEGSKSFAKHFMQRHGIPSAGFATFSEVDAALAHLAGASLPVVVKADGLAAGKGVVVAQTLEDAQDAVRAMLDDNRFGDAGARVVIEEFLAGEEASFIVMVAGLQYLALASSQDHKARDDGDRGPNTGGMGAYSPAPVVTPSVHERVMREIVRPTITGLAAEELPFTGFLYVGLMIDPNGAPSVVEYNVRLGDPETQPLMMRLQSDLSLLFDAALDGRLDETTAEWSDESALGIVLAAGEYPAGSSRGVPITGLDSADASCRKVFHSGTARDENDGWVTNGGRVVCVTALGDDVAAARRHAQQGADLIDWPERHYRRDIGHRAITGQRHR